MAKKENDRRKALRKLVRSKSPRLYLHAKTEEERQERKKAARERGAALAAEKRRQEGAKPGKRKDVNPNSRRQQIFKLMKQGLSAGEIAKKLGAPVAEVRRRINESPLRPETPTSASGRKMDLDFFYFCKMVLPMLEADTEHGRFKRIGDAIGEQGQRVRIAFLAIEKNPDAFR